MRIAVADVLGWLDAGQTYAQILDDFPELTEDDIEACLAFAAGNQVVEFVANDNPSSSS